MPSYIYTCSEHGEFEEFHSITDQLKECPKCKADGKDPVPPKRLIAGSSFILSSGGVGWGKEGYSK